MLSPGSRSTPLALALAAQFPTTVLHDERVAAFFALGQARAGGRPSVVLATSGTAPGHWLPAVMEAREGGVPLLLVSADRPWEVQEAQASQGGSSSPQFSALAKTDAVVLFPTPSIP